MPVQPASAVRISGLGVGPRFLPPNFGSESSLK